MFDNRIPYSGCSVEFLQSELTQLKDLIRKVKFMSRPANFTYMDCATLSQSLETLKNSLEATIQEKLSHEEN